MRKALTSPFLPLLLAAGLIALQLMLAMHALSQANSAARNGARAEAISVGTGTSAVRLGEVKAFGKKQMAAADWARGVRLEDGARLGG